MHDLRFYQPIVKFVERALTIYSKNVRAIFIFIIIFVAGKNAGKYLLFLVTGALSLSLAVLKLIYEKGVLLDLHVSCAVFILVNIFIFAFWLIATFSITHHFKVEYSSVSKMLLPFFGLLNLFVFYVIIGGYAIFYSVLIIFILSALIYYISVFLKNVNYRGKEFIFWNLYPIPADELLFPIEDSGRLKKYKITLRDDTRNAILNPNDSGFFSKPIQVFGGDKLDFSIGLAEKVFSGICVFEIYVYVKGEPVKKIFSHHMSPAAKISDRTWKQFQIDLADYSNRELILCFKTHFKNKKQSIEAYWEFPKLTNDKKRKQVLSSKDSDIENIIILVMDAVRFDLFQRVASIQKGMPNIASFFSRNSICCNRAFTQNDWTVPAFASIFSGRYAAHHQHFVSRPMSYQRPISSGLKWLPKILQENGYLTYGFSDYCEINPAHGFARGFDSFFNGENTEEVDHGEKVSLHGLRFLRENEGLKKFLFLHYFSTHRPFKTRHPYRISANPYFSNWFNPESISYFMNTPYEMLNAEDKQAIVDIYCSSIAQVDRDLSIIFDYLVSKQQADRSLVILTSDHGYSLFDRNSFSPKVTALYEEIIHAPLFLKAPEDILKSESKKVVDDLVEANVDIFPTVLDVIGLKENAASDGYSLLKLVAGDMPSRKHVISELYDTKSNTYMLSIRGERYKLISTYNFDASKLFTFKTAKKKEELLFDLFMDPCEKIDISKEKNNILLEYRELEKRFSDTRKESEL